MIGHIAASRYSILRETWNNRKEVRVYGHTRWKEESHGLISRQITRIREELLKLLTDPKMLAAHPEISFVQSIETTQLKQSCIMLHILGFDEKTTADILCINPIFVSFLHEEFPEYFK